MNDNINVADDGYNWPYHGSKLIPKEDLKPFLKRDNISGLKHLFLHLSLIAISGILIYLSPSIYLTIPVMFIHCLLYTSPSPRDRTRSRMPSSA